VLVDLEYEFFDPGYYNDNQEMERTSITDFTILNNAFG
jgi:hypothetical protein